MLVGSGWRDPYFKNLDYYSTYHRDVRMFVEKVDKGDAVVMKKLIEFPNYWEITAAGIINKKYYKFQEVFEDVEGWNLSHCRFVDWRVPARPVKIKGLSPGTFKGFHLLHVKKAIDKIISTGEIHPSSSQIPKPANKLTDKDLSVFLVESGLRNNDAEKVIKTLNKVRRLLDWYSKKGLDISEHETRAFLVIPLLLALGWTEKHLRIEWNKIDIAFFKDRSRNRCNIILESKRLWKGLLEGINQAWRYARKHPDCKKFIVTDGHRYRLYELTKNKWKFSAYLNISNPKQRHPFEKNVKGAQDVFLSLMNK